MRAGNRIPHAAPHGVFPARGDDRWIAIAIVDDRRWRALTELARIPEFADQELERLDGRKAHEDEVEMLLAAWTASQDADELAAALAARGIAASPVRTPDELLAGVGGLRDRGAFEWLEHPVMGRSVYSAPTPRLSATPGLLASAAPLLGADTDEVLLTIAGYSIEEIAELRADGVLT